MRNIGTCGRDNWFAMDGGKCMEHAGHVDPNADDDVDDEDGIVGG